jgi:hypothetical protein
MLESRRVIMKNDNVLICQRAKDEYAGLLWEFREERWKEGETRRSAS